MSPARQELSALLTLAWPIVVAQVGMNLMSLVDTALVGPLGPDSLSALALGGTIYFGILILGQGTLMSLDAHVSAAWGAGDKAGCRRGLQQGIWLALGMAPLLMGAMTVAPDLLILAGYDEAMAELARVYVGPLRWGVPVSLLFTCHRSFLAATDVTRPLLISAVIANLLNVGLDLWWIDGGLGLPAFGVEGVAWATATCRLALLAPVAWVAWRRADYRSFPRVSWRPDTALMGRLLNVGVPVGLQYFAEVSAFAGAAILMGALGAIPLAAHQIALNSASIAFMVPLGLGAAAAVRVGQARGRGDAAGVGRAGWTALGVGFVWSVISAAVFTLAPGAIAGFYGVDGGVFILALDFLALAAIFQVPDGIQAVAVGVLRGLADTRAAFVMALLGYGLVATPCAVLGAFVLADDPRFIWWGLVAGLSVASIAMVLRFRWQVRELAT